MQELEADLVLWTAGSQPSSKASPGMELPFPLTDKGAMRTDDTLQVQRALRLHSLCVTKFSMMRLFLSLRQTCGLR